MYIEAHPIDPGILYCCYTANNNDWFHHQQKKYRRFVKSSLVAKHKKGSTNKGMLTTKTEANTRFYSYCSYEFCIHDMSTIFYSYKQLFG